MPGHDEHQRLALAIGGIGGPVGGYVVYRMTGSLLGAVGVGVIGSLVVLVGGGIPDTDSRSSIPRRHLDSLLAVAGVAVVIGAAWVYWEAMLAAVTSTVASILPSVDPMIMVVVGLVVGILAVPVALQRGADALIPSHRGPLHNIGFWIALTAAVIGVVYLDLVRLPAVPEDVQKVGIPIVGVLFLLGVAGHLYQDGEL